MLLTARQKINLKRSYKKEIKEKNILNYSSKEFNISFDETTNAVILQRFKNKTSSVIKNCIYFTFATLADKQKI